MKFFTDLQTTISSYCLLNIKNYSNKKKESKLMIYIDPSVYELKESAEYSKISLLHELAGGRLLENEYISIDYPCDMNLQYQDEFIEKSIKNNLRYKDKHNYIATVQSKFEDFNDFKKQFEYLEEQIDFNKKIVGIGNLCRILHPNTFTDEVFDFLSHKKAKSFHFYGLALRLIKKYSWFFNSNPNTSVDSTKWTRACNANLKKHYGLNCNKNTRNLFFISYISEIKKYIENIMY